MKILKRVLEILIIVVLLGWIVVVVSEFMNVKEGNDPKFCLSTKNTQYDDNKITYECTGLGYKVYKYYENNEETGTEFGIVFFVNDRNAQ